MNEEVIEDVLRNLNYDLENILLLADKLQTIEMYSVEARVILNSIIAVSQGILTGIDLIGRLKIIESSAGVFKVEKTEENSEECKEPNRNGYV